MWEEKFGSPSSVSGASSAISCVRRGLPIFSVIVNYITQELFISCAMGNKAIKLPDDRLIVDLDYVSENGNSIIFPNIDGEVERMQKFVTFLGDTGKSGYFENFRDSGFIPESQMNELIYEKKPGGPSRSLYLSSLQPKGNKIGFVLANGEKIGEWIHWLSFIRFARSKDDNSQPALVMYEIFQDRPWTKEGVLMSTHPNYSVFREYNGKIYLDTSWLLRMPNPSKLRSTLIVSSYDNRWVVQYAAQFGYREIKF